MCYQCLEGEFYLVSLQPEEDVNDDYLFPMASRLSYAAGRENDNEAFSPRDDFELSPKHKKRLVRSSSDPSVNTTDKIPGIPPYPAPPSYHRSVSQPTVINILCQEILHPLPMK